VARLLEIVTALLAAFYRCRSEIHSVAAFMLDDLLIDLLEEIALDGRKGIHTLFDDGHQIFRALC
jgi:hypothetical protein